MFWKSWTNDQGVIMRLEGVRLNMSGYVEKFPQEPQDAFSTWGICDLYILIHGSKRQVNMGIHQPLCSPIAFQSRLELIVFLGSSMTIHQFQSYNLWLQSLRSPASYRLIMWQDVAGFTILGRHFPKLSGDFWIILGFASDSWRFTPAALSGCQAATTMPSQLLQESSAATSRASPARVVSTCSRWIIRIQHHSPVDGSGTLKLTWKVGKFGVSKTVRLEANLSKTCGCQEGPWDICNGQTSPKFVVIPCLKAIKDLSLGLSVTWLITQGQQDNRW